MAADPKRTQRSSLAIAYPQGPQSQASASPIYRLFESRFFSRYRLLLSSAFVFVGHPLLCFLRPSERQLLC